MTFKTKIKLSVITLIFMLLSFAFSFEASASDYQYKILDPKYNPSAEQLVNGNLANVGDIKQNKATKTFDFGRFFAILCSVTFSLFVVSTVIKSFKEVTKDITTTDLQVASGLVKEDSIEQSFADKTTIEEKIEPERTVLQIVETEENVQETSLKDNFSKAAVSTPVSSTIKNLSNRTLIGKNKGLGFIENNQKSTLVGFINEKIFVLNEFPEQKTNEIRAKLL